MHSAASPGAEGKDRLGPAIDFAAIMRRLENDRELFRNFVEIFDEDAQNYWNRYYRPRRAQDLAAIRRAAHALKGLAANFDAKDLAEIAGRLELADADGFFQDQAALPEKLPTRLHGYGKPWRSIGSRSLPNPIRSPIFNVGRPSHDCFM